MNSPNHIIFDNFVSEIERSNIRGAEEEVSISTTKAFESVPQTIAPTEWNLFLSLLHR